MQLRGIVIYHRDGVRSREVKLEPGALNVITGVSETGKSALIEIVDYCLGSDRHNVYRSKELETIGWYGLRLRIDDQPVFVARRAPDPGNKTSDHAMLLLGVDRAPAAEAMTPTTNAGAVTARLAELIGIDDGDHDATEGSGRAPVRAGLRHALAYVFQRQRLIADPEYLFSGQDRPFAAMAIRDTLPYFLGAVASDALQQRRELRVRRQELARSRAQLRQVTERSSEIGRREVAILREARQAGLASDAVEVPSEDVRATLASIIELSLDEAGETLSGEAEQVARLEDRRREVSERLREARAARRRLVERQRLATAYAREGTEHRARLLSLELLADAEDGGDAPCPLCGLPSERPDPAADDLRAELVRATAQAESAVTSEARLERAIEGFDAQVAELRGIVAEIEREIAAAVRRSEIARRVRSRREIQAYVRGRITAFLEEHPVVDRAALRDLETEVDVKTRQVDVLERALSPDTTRVRTDRTLGRIGVDMTSMAKRLELGYTEGGVRLDPVVLTVVSGGDDDPMWLSGDMGSGKNWVGYHLVTLLALHRHFATEGRPVPRLLMLDQPTQAFYPSERRRAGDRSVAELADEDQAMVRRLFELMRDTVAALNGKLQVVVTDHADIAEDWFGQAVEHDWRDGRALVPRDWYE